MENPKTTTKTACVNVKKSKLTVKSGVRAGDVYMQYPRGSNNRLND